MGSLVNPTPTLALPLKGREADSFPFRGKVWMGVGLIAMSVRIKFIMY